jgi:hypothetical protein
MYNYLVLLKGKFENDQIFFLTSDHFENEVNLEI